MKTIADCVAMNITGVKGLNESTLAQPLHRRIASLKALGAIEDEEVRETVE
jgi:hypothetical protein